MFSRRTKTLVFAAVLAGAAVQPAAADSQGAIGFGAGAAFGALVAGPPGAILGALGGGLFERSRHLEHAHARDRRALARTEARVADLKGRLAARDVKPTRARAGTAAAGHRSTPAAVAVARGFTLSVPFRTDSAAVEPHFRARLQNLAGALKAFPGLQVVLAGYADPRGTDAHNLALSRRRVAAVRRLLLDSGIASRRIEGAGHGEADALVPAGDREGLFFDRRVVITFTLTGNPA